MAENGVEDSEVNRPSGLSPASSKCWPLLTLICVCFAGRNFVATGYAVSKQAIAGFFGLAESEIEILRCCELLTAAVVAFLIATKGQAVKLRGLTIGTAIFLFVSSGASAVGFMNRGSLWMIVISFVSSGIATGMIYLIPTLFADVWMSPALNSLAFGITYAFLYLGSAVSQLTFYSMYNATVISVNSAGVDRHAYRLYVGAYGGVSLCIFTSMVLMCVSLENQILPPYDDTFEHIEVEEANEGCGCCNTRLSFRQIRNILSNPSLTLMMCANFFGASVQVYSLYLMPGILLTSFPETTPIAITLFYTFAMLFGIIGCSIAVAVLLRYQQPKPTCLAGSVGVLVSSIALYMSYEFEEIVAIVIFQFFITFFGTFFAVALLEMLLALNKNAHKPTLLALYFGFFHSGSFVFNLLERFLARPEQGDLPLLIILLAALTAPCLLLWAFASRNKKNKQSESSTMADIRQQVADEQTRLVENGSGD